MSTLLKSIDAPNRFANNKRGFLFTVRTLGTVLICPYYIDISM